MRPLSADEERLWAKVVETVRPLDGSVSSLVPDGVPAKAGTQEASKLGSGPRRSATPPPPPKGVGETLDGSWDRRLSRGLVAPDAALDLHGSDLGRAYDRLDSFLERSIAEGHRLLLLVTGKPPGPERPVKRGAIRAAVGDWLQASRHAADIAAVRGAHRRHGGSGALYIVLRRRRR